MWTFVVPILTLISSFVLVFAWPTMFFMSISRLRRERNIRPLLRTLSIAGGLAAGVFAGWHIIVVQYGWPLSFGETFYATVHYDIYGKLEGAAEDYVFFMLFLGNIGAILAGITGWLIAKFRQKTPLVN
jgi:hypothetical protein